MIILLLVIDQTIKILVKTNMCLHESIEITPWFFINFIENNGMAFGMTFINKMVLSLFRLVLIGIICYYIWLQTKRKAPVGYIFLLSVIVAGAMGNLFDSMFYGLIFSGSSPFYTSYFVPFGTGYAPFLMGKVVDMFYFPLVETNFPQWIPFVGGEHFIFFSPVFNFADACVWVGVVSLFIFYNKELGRLTLKKEKVAFQKDCMDDSEKDGKGDSSKAGEVK